MGNPHFFKNERKKTEIKTLKQKSKNNLLETRQVKWRDKLGRTKIIFLFVVSVSASVEAEKKTYSKNAKNENFATVTS